MKVKVTKKSIKAQVIQASRGRFAMLREDRTCYWSFGFWAWIKKVSSRSSK